MPVRPQPKAYQCKITQSKGIATHMRLEVFSVENRIATRTFREKTTITVSSLFFDLILISTVAWITEKELERETKSKGD